MKVCPRCSELYPDDADSCPRDGTELRTVLDPLIGKTVGGRFRLIQRLGSGGMSSVYLARHVLIDRLMAIKTLRRDLARDPIQRNRFLREARAVNRINHANIVEISDFGETEDGLVYLVMEYVPGDQLLKLLEDGPLPPLRALDIIEQCGNALARAHQMGVIHRDLKPENILIVQRKSRRDFVKLLDFGIAKILDAPSLTGSQQIFGTPGYIAPEYIQSTDIDGRSDLYSLGCILYELITGALPFDYEYPGDLLVKHVTEQPIRPSVRLPGVEPAMEAFILRCLAKNPDERFRDAFHFIAELRAVRERLGPAESWGSLDETKNGRRRIRSDRPTEGDIEVLSPPKATDEAARTAPAALRVHVAELRKLIEQSDEQRSLLLTVDPGYRLELQRDELDLYRFERLLEEAGKQGGADAAAASATLREALALWRGPALADFAYESFARQAIGRLEELRLVAHERCIEAELELARQADLIPEIEQLLAEHPLRERLRGQLMLALYRAGRQADALAAFQETRRVMAEELGIEPGQPLQRLEQQILSHDPTLDLDTPEATPAVGDSPPAPAAAAVPPDAPVEVPDRSVLLFGSANRISMRLLASGRRLRRSPDGS